MPSLKDRIDNLRLKTGMVITEDFFTGLADVIEDMAFYGAITYDGYVRKDLEPIQDLALNLGSENFRFDEIHAGSGYFTYNVLVQGKPVIKDGDPINIAYFFDQALDQLLNTLGSLKPIEVARTIGYQAPPLADIFASDVEVSNDGRIRVKIKSDASVYVYLKWYPYGALSPDIGLLNEGNPIPSNVFKEFDSTVSKGDKVNVRVYPGAKVTVFLFNIPSA